MTAQTDLPARLKNHWFKANGPRPNGLLLALFWAISLLYRSLQTLRGALRKPRVLNPGGRPRIISIGNLIVGGAGKTPVVIALAQSAAKRGLKAAILSRGYKSAAEYGGGKIIDPKRLSDTDPQGVGDEPWLIAWRTGAAVCVGKNRALGFELLKKENPDLDVVILDDGLSQRDLAWDESVLVMDGRGFGNAQCLPFGPLREPLGDLSRFDHWVDNGFAQNTLQLNQFSASLPASRGTLTQSAETWVDLCHWQEPLKWLDIEAGITKFRSQKILAVAGIAVPDRFFGLLDSMGIAHTPLALADHDPEIAAKVARQCEQSNYDCILMTEKDAVKFFHHLSMLKQPGYALRRSAQLDEAFTDRLFNGL